MHDLDLTDINVMNSPYFYLQPNDYIYQTPQTKKLGKRKDGWSLGLLYIVVIGNNDLLLLFKIKTEIKKMLDIKDFQFFEDQVSFDFKGF
jgi:hypothetical protein